MSSKHEILQFKPKVPNQSDSGSPNLHRVWHLGIILFLASYDYPPPPPPPPPCGRAPVIRPARGPIPVQPPTSRGESTSRLVMWQPKLSYTTARWLVPQGPCLPPLVSTQYPFRRITGNGQHNREISPRAPIAEQLLRVL